MKSFAEIIGESPKKDKKRKSPVGFAVETPLPPVEIKFEPISVGE